MINPRRFFFSLAVAAALSSTAVAAPVTYRFTTSDTPFGDGFVSSLLPLMAGGASGSFVYDNQFTTKIVNPDGSFFYRGFTPESATGIPTTLSALSGTVGGFSFSDLSGATQVGNDNFSGGDLLQLFFDPFPAVRPCAT
jgi:hypothetical protein